MEFGVDAWICYPAFSIEEALEVIEKNYFKCIEYPYEYFRDVDPKDLDSYVRHVAEVSESYSVKPLQLHAVYGDICYDLGSLDPQVREKATKEVLKWVEYAAVLGVEVLVVHVAFTRPFQGFATSRRLEYQLRVNLEYASKLARLARENGVKVALENTVEPWFGSSLEDLAYVIESTDPDVLGICLDTGHANRHSFNIPRLIEEYSDKIIATHIHDNDGRHDLHYPPFMGTIPWEDVVRAFEKAGYGKPLIYEVPGTKSKAMCLNKLKLLEIISRELQKITA